MESQTISLSIGAGGETTLWRLAQGIYVLAVEEKMSEKDGGPAFPIPGQVFALGNGVFTKSDHLGLTVRDVFAAAALSGVDIVDHLGKTKLNAAEGASTIAKAAFIVADAMLVERAK